MKNAKSQTWILLASFLISACSGGGGSPAEEHVSSPSDDRFSVLATATRLNVIDNDGEFSESAYIRIESSSKFSERVAEGDVFSLEGVRYLPSSEEHPDWPVSTVFGEEDSFTYVVISDGEIVSGPSLVVVGIEPFLVVDAVGGSDFNNGTMAQPLKTITEAVSRSEPGCEIKVMPGNYDFANGETFPIVLTEHIKLIGDPELKGAAWERPTKIQGGGSYESVLLGESIAATIVMDTGFLGHAVLNGFSIEGGETMPTQSHGVVMLGHGDQLMRSTVFHYEIGIFLKTIGGDIAGTEIYDCAVGIVSLPSLVPATVRRCGIRFNEVGIYIELVGSLDLGTSGDPGENLIACNKLGVGFGSTLTIQDAQGNFWNEWPLVLLGGGGLPSEFNDLEASDEPLVHTNGGQAYEGACH
jgi:hypothetical protein